MLPNQLKLRSSLRRVSKEEDVDGDETTTNRNIQSKRRISFRDKKSVRVFQITEKTRSYDNSYELSDHTNGEESATAESGANSGGAAAVSLVTLSDKENVPLSSFQVDSTFNFHTSIDITLLPNERKRRCGNDKAVVIGHPNESLKEHLTSSSLCLSPAKRDQLRNNSLKHPIFDKTVDLFPEDIRSSQKHGDQSLAITPVSKDTPAIISPLGVCRLQSFEIENEDTTPLKSLSQPSGNAAKNDNMFDTSINHSFDSPVLKNNQHLESFQSSPLISMDMISVQGIKPPKNFRQLNEAIEAGKISVCPDGPKTPSTDRKARHPKFLRDFEQETGVQDTYESSLGIIKPRPTLNFNESTIMSSPAAVIVPTSFPKHKLKYRYSQADEILLDNTNFLAHAKLGDETESCNSSSHAESPDISNINSKLKVEHLSQRAHFHAKNVKIPKTELEMQAKYTEIMSLLQMEESVEEDNLMSSFRELQLESEPSMRDFATTNTVGKDIAIQEGEYQITEQLIEKQVLNYTENQQTSNSKMDLDESIKNIDLCDNLMAKTEHATFKKESTKFGITAVLAESIKDYDRMEQDYTAGIPKLRNTLHLATPMDESFGNLSLVSTANPIAMHQRSKARSTMLMSEAIELDAAATHKGVTPVVPTGIFNSKARNTLLLTEPIEEDLTTTSQNISENPLTKLQKPKPRSTLLLSEPIEEDTVVSHKNLPSIAPTGGVKFTTRNTLLLTEPIEEDLNIVKQDGPDFPVANDKKSEARSTLLMSEPIKEDTDVSPKDCQENAATGYLKSKVRNTLYLTKPMEKDLTTSSQNMPQVPSTKYQKPKSRSTLLMSEAMEEDTVASHGDTPAIAPTGGVKFKARSTLLLTEPIEEDLNVMRQDDPDVPAANHKKSRARSTLLMSEPIEEDTEVSPKDCQENAATGYLKSKVRNTLYLTKPMEKDLTTSSQNMPELPSTKYQKPKSRSTLLMSEAIEEDTVASHGDTPAIAPTGGVKFKARNTLLLTEPIEEDLNIVRQDGPNIPVANHKKSRARSTLLMSEAIEEDTDVSPKDCQDNAATGYLKSKARNTLYLTNPMEEDLTTSSQNMPEIPSTKYQKPKCRSTLLMSEAIEEDTAASQGDTPAIGPTGGVKFRARNTLLLTEPIEEDLNIIRQYGPDIPVANHKKSRARSTLLMSEAIEEDTEVSPKDCQENAATGYLKSKARNTLYLTKPIEEDLTTSSQNMPQVPSTKYQKPKSRSTLLMSEAIEEDTAASHGDTRPIAPIGGVKFKARNTLLLTEPIEEDLNVVRQDGPDIPVANHKNSRARSTLLMSEAIEEDTEVSPKDCQENAATGYLKSKARNTLYLTKPMEEDLTSIQNMLEVPSTKYQKPKSRSTLLMSEAIEEDTVASHGDTPAIAPTGGLKFKARNTLLLTEPIEEDLNVVRQDDPDVPVANQQKSRTRSTLLMSEAIEEDTDVSPKDCQENAATGYLKSKARNTLHLAKPMEEDLTTSSQNMPEVPSTKYRKPKSRSTLLMSEAIEEDTVASHRDTPAIAPTGGVKFTARNTFLLTEPIEEDLNIVRQDDPDVQVANHKKSRAGSTLIMSEAKEEDAKTLYESLPAVVSPENLKFKARHTLVSTEPMEEDLMTSSQNISKIPVIKHQVPKPRSTLLLADAIIEDTMGSAEELPDTSPAGYLQSKAWNTLLLTKPMEKGHSQNIPKVPLTKHQKSKARSTLLMSESIEEDREASLKSFNIDESFSKFDIPTVETGIQVKNRDVLIPTEASMLTLGKDFNNAHTSLMSEEVDKDRTLHQNLSIKHKMCSAKLGRHIDLDVVNTPPNKAKRACFAITPGRSLIEFENVEEETAVDSAHQVPVRRNPVPRTPMSRVKRLHSQLTPNLPQSKKRLAQFHEPITIDQDKEFDVDKTVQVLRCARSRELCENAATFPDKSITISDVSNYFEIQRRQDQEQENKKSEKGQLNEQSRRDTMEGEMIPSEGIQTYNKFINITGDTIVIPLLDESSQQEIDEVRLSLVSNLIDEEVDRDETEMDVDPLPASTTVDGDVCLEMTLDRPIAAGTSSSCRKCQNCRRSLSSTIITEESFILSPIKNQKLIRNLEQLERLREKPHFNEIHKYFELKECELNYSIIALPRAEQTELEEESSYNVQSIKGNEIMQLFGDLPQRNKNQDETIYREDIFESIECRLATEQPQWIFDHQLRVSRKMLFTHRQYAHVFRIGMTYDSLDNLDTAIRITAIQLEPTRPLSSWIPLDYVLHFQLGLKLPVKPLDFLGGQDVESLITFLKQINQICLDIRTRVGQMAKIVSSNISTLIRQKHRTVVRKTSFITSPIDSHGIMRIQEKVFMVEITNLEEISFKDIVQPQLHMFDKNIQFLPKGVAFLEAFLPNPEKYLRQDSNQ
ncbi:uncharacterized protein Spc105R [Drosophila tropicalis]|uniref:uncharacterized protein Spc105R n=1 Tax=Drosophila tropicalis TaxID=46794 RepID=UPI0035AB77C5